MTESPKIAAIITIYQPPQRLETLIERVAPQVAEVIVVDNGENEAVSGCHWLKNPENGLAKAQNKGIAKAHELGCTHILLLDDDSLPAADMVARLLSGLKKARKEGGREVAIAGPYIEEEALGQPPKYIRPKGKYNFTRVSFDETTPILRDLFYVAASGSLMPIDIFDHIGNLKEEFFIYFIDTEFCLRARKHGFDIIAVRDAKISHRFGQRSNHEFLGHKFSTTNHPPQAREYMFRNRKKLWIKYFESDAGYVWFDILRAQSEVLRIILFEKNKTEKLAAIMRGFLS